MNTIDRRSNDDASTEALAAVRDDLVAISQQTVRPPDENVAVLTAAVRAAAIAR